MTGINSSNSAEGRSENQNRQTQSTDTLLQKLLKESLDDTVSEDVPTWLNQYSKNTDDFNTQLKVLMKEKRNEGKVGRTDNQEGTWAITDTEIDNIEASTVQQEVIRKTRRLTSLRSQLFYSLKTTYPQIRDEADWESRIMREIKIRNVSDMAKFVKNIKNKRIISPFFKSIFWQNIAESILTPEIRNLGEIFSDVDSLRISLEEKKDLSYIVKNHERGGRAPGSDEIRRILGYYSWATPERKKSLLISLGVTLSLYDAHSYGLVTDPDFDRIANRYFGDAYTSLDTRGKELFRKSLRQKSSDGNIMISLDEIEGDHLENIFTDIERTQIIAENIFERLSNEIPEKNRPEADILRKAREMFPEEEDHQLLFNKYTEATLRNTETGRSIEGIASLNKDSIIEFGEWDEKMRFSIIENTDGNDFPYEVNNGLSLWVRIEELPVSNGYLRKWAQEDLTYDALYGFFSQHVRSAKVMKNQEFRESLGDTPDTISEGKIYDARELSAEISRSNIIPKLDEFDSDWRAYGFSIGTYFTAPEEEKDGKAEVRTWKVNAIGDDWIEITSEGASITERVSMREIVALAEAKRLKRVTKIESESDLLIGLREYGITHDAEIKDHEIAQKNKDEKWNVIDEHIRVFRDNSGGHIRVDGIADGKVLFWEYVYQGEEHEVSNFAEKKWTKSAFQKFYKSRVLTYGAFLEYLKKNKLRASSNDIIDTHAHTDHAHDHSHMEGSLLSRLGKMQNPASIWKGLEMVWHSLEHTLEKWAKLDAARFAMKIGKFIPWDAVEAQLYADIVDGSKEIVEKIKNKIANLPGPKWRKKCIHIAHNRDARPEEVMAAIQFMVSGYGHLYAEDTRHYQSTVTRANLASKPMWYFAYLDAFIHTTRLPGGIEVWRQKAYEKAKPLLWSEGEPPEEALLHALFKSIDGNPDQFPYAASVVKAIGGPGGYEASWHKEGTTNAIQKWKDQTRMVNAQGRLNKAIWYLATHEFYKGIGAMEKVAGKVKDPSFQAFPFVWAVGGYSKFASPEALQDIKNYAQNGLSFHGYAFLQKEEHNTLYRETVRLALAEMRDRGKINQWAIDEFNGICARMDNGPESQDESEKKYGKVNPPGAMMEFWKKYQGKWLSDMLQGHDGWLTVASKKNATVAKYRAHLIGQHSTMLKDGSIPWTDYGKDWYDEHGIGMNLIMRESEVEPWVRSLLSNLNKIKFQGPNRGGRPMDDNNKMKIWDYIVKNIRENRNLDRYYGDEALQKKEFLAWREELITFFNKELNAGEVKDDNDIERLINTKWYSYFQDLTDIGIDPRAIFHNELLKNNEKSDYQSWKNGMTAGSSSNGSAGIIDRVKWRTSWVRGRSPAPLWKDPDISTPQAGDHNILSGDGDT